MLRERTFDLFDKGFCRQCVIEFQTLFLYPWLRSRHIADCSLTLVGIVSRLLGRLWIGIAWNTASVFLCKSWANNFVLFNIIFVRSFQEKKDDFLHSCSVRSLRSESL